MKTAPRETLFVKKSFYTFFLPSLLSCLGLALGGLADCIFVGNTVGPVGLSAISIGQPVYMLFTTGHGSGVRVSLLYIGMRANNPNMELDFAPFLLSAFVYTAVFTLLAVRHLRRHDVAAE